VPRPVLTDRLEPGFEGRVVLVSAAPKGWRARIPATPRSAEIPGTAVRWEEGLFEVVDAAALPGGGVRYELASWDARHSARHVETYDEANERHRAAEERRDRRREDSFALVVLLSPLLGHLPSDLQQKIEDETAFPAPRLTVVSAIPLALFGTVCLLSVLVGGVGGGDLVPPGLAFVGVLLLLESTTRISVAVAQGRPVGSLAGETLAAAVRAVHRRAARAAGHPVGRGRSLRDVNPPDGETETRDLFRTREPLLALLSVDEQTLLAERYGFDGLRWGRTTARFLLFALSPLAFAYVGGFLMLPDAVDVPPAVLFTALVAEQLLRLRKIRRGELAPSVLGVAVRPFCRKLLGPA
jgi:hypothetical protein